MDRSEWFPHPFLAICQQDHIDIVIGIVTNHRAHTRIDALFLREQDFAAPVNSEPHPIAVHLPPLHPYMVKHLRSKKCTHGWGRKQSACFQLAQKLVQVASGDIRATIRRANGRVRIDIFLPGHNDSMLITQRITSLGEIVIDHIHAEEIRHEGNEEAPTFLSSKEPIWLFALQGLVSFRESPEHESCDEHCNQHQESNQHTKSEERIVEEEDLVFQSFYDPYWLIEWDGSLGIVDNQHIAIAFIIIPSPIAGIQNGRSKRCIRFFFDQAGFFQVSADSISFQVHGRSNMMGGKMGGSAQFNPAIIGCLSYPDELSTDERSRLPEANMPAVCDIVGGLFKRQILDSPKDVEITDWCSGVTFVSETVNGNFLRGLEGNGIRNEPPCLLKAVCNLIFAPNKDEIEGVSLCPGFCMSYLWIGREIIGVRVKTEKGNECCYKHHQNTEHAHDSDDRFSHTSSLVGRFQNISIGMRLPDREMLPPEQLQLLCSKKLCCENCALIREDREDTDPSFVLMRRSSPGSTHGITMIMP